MAWERFWNLSYASGIPPEVEIGKITMAEALSKSAQWARS
jgi:hypothetical protein